MDEDTILKQLELSAEAHEGRARFHTAEAKRYRDALAALRGPVPAQPKQTYAQTVATGEAAVQRILKRGPTSTMSMIRSELGKTFGPISVIDLTDRMLAGGWETTSGFPQNTVRTALGRLVDRGEVVRGDGGGYSLSGKALISRVLHLEGPEDDDADDQE